MAAFLGRGSKPVFHKKFPIRHSPLHTIFLGTFSSCIPITNLKTGAGLDMVGLKAKTPWDVPTGFTFKNAYTSGLFCGSSGGTRTPDRVVNSHLLYRLSYRGMNKNEIYSMRALQSTGISSTRDTRVAKAIKHKKIAVPRQKNSTKTQ
jgi:hypothetical protein